MNSIIKLTLIIYLILLNISYGKTAPSPIPALPTVELKIWEALNESWIHLKEKKYDHSIKVANDAILKYAPEAIAKQKLLDSENKDSCLGDNATDIDSEKKARDEYKIIGQVGLLYINKAKALAELGKKDEAIKNYKEAMKLRCAYGYNKSKKKYWSISSTAKMRIKELEDNSADAGAI